MLKCGRRRKWRDSCMCSNRFRHNSRCVCVAADVSMIAGVVMKAGLGATAYEDMTARCGCRRQVWVLGVCVPCREG